MASEDGASTARRRVARFLAGGDVDVETLRAALRQLRAQDPSALAAMLRAQRGHASSCRDVLAVLAEYRAWDEPEARRLMPAVALHLVECEHCAQALAVLADGTLDEERREWLALSRELASSPPRSAVARLLAFIRDAAGGALMLGRLPAFEGASGRAGGANPSVAGGMIESAFYFPPEQGVYVTVSSREASLAGLAVHVRVGDRTHDAALTATGTGAVSGEAYFTAEELRAAGEACEVWLAVDPLPKA